MKCNEMPLPLANRKLLAVNGKIMKAAEGEKDCVSLVFPTEDPNINLNLAELALQEENILTVKLQVVKLPLALAQDMAGAVKRIF